MWTEPTGLPRKKKPLVVTMTSTGCLAIGLSIEDASQRQDLDMAQPEVGVLAEQRPRRQAGVQARDVVQGQGAGQLGGLLDARRAFDVRPAPDRFAKGAGTLPIPPR